MKIRILDHDYDQFVLGAGPSGEPTLVHLGAPQFICKIAPDIRAVPEDNYVHACADGRTLHCIAFLGEPVTTPEDFTALMAQAESALRRIPHCAELIKAKAIKCKHCGSAVEPEVTA